MRTLILSRQEITNLITLPELIEGLSAAYIIYSTEKSIKAQRNALQVDSASIVINAPGYIPGSSMITVKINSKLPNNPSRGLPFLMGTILLIDIQTGHVLSILDSGLITAMRTGAAGAVGVKHLADPLYGKVALIGAGVQGEWQIRALHAIGRVKQLIVYDIDLQQATKLANLLAEELDICVKVSRTLKDAVQESNIIITTTQSKAPIITPDICHPNMYINAFGADQPGKVEIAKKVFEQSTVVVDDKKLAITDGALNVAYECCASDIPINIHEIGEIISNPALLESGANNITIFGNVGLAFQDLIACSIIYKKAIELNYGVWVDFDSDVHAPAGEIQCQKHVSPTTLRAKL